MPLRCALRTAASSSSRSPWKAPAAVQGGTRLRGGTRSLESGALAGTCSRRRLRRWWGWHFQEETKCYCTEGSEATLIAGDAVQWHHASGGRCRSFCVEPIERDSSAGASTVHATVAERLAASVSLTASGVTAGPPGAPPREDTFKLDPSLFSFVGRGLGDGDSAACTNGQPAEGVLEWGRHRAGEQVELTNLRAAPSLNGQRGTLLFFDPQALRWRVQLGGALGRKALKPENLIFLHERSLLDTEDDAVEELEMEQEYGVADVAAAAAAKRPRLS